MRSSKAIVIVGGFAESLLNFRGELMAEMVALGHRVTACAPNASAETINGLREIGVRYRHVSMDRTGINPFRDIGTFFSLFFLFLRKRPEIFLAYTIKSVIFGSIAAKFAMVDKRYAMITGLGWSLASESGKQSLMRYLIIALYRYSLRGSRVIFFQNCDDRDFFLENSIIKSIKNTTIINGSGVDIDFFSTKPLPEDISFLLIGRFLFDKGIYEYVEAIRCVKRKYPSVCFYLAGWSDNNPASISEEEIQAWVKEGLFTCYGHLNDVRPAIAASSVYVLPSYREGTPRTVLEAMSMGRPVITTDAPGCRETVKENVNGFLVPIKDSVALAEAMLHFIRQPELVERMGRESRAYVVEKYNVCRVNEKILSYMELCLQNDHLI